MTPFDFTPDRSDPDQPTLNDPLEQITPPSDPAARPCDVQNQPAPKAEVWEVLNLSNEAFGALLEQYRDSLRRLAKDHLGKGVLRRMSHSDIIQEAFLIAIAKQDQFRGTTPREFRSWLVRIFLSQVADGLRRHVQAKSRGIKNEVRSSVELPENGGKTPSVIAVFNETVEMLLRLFPKLTPLEQEILTLHYWEKLRFDDIASRKNVSTNTVRYHWHQSLEKLSQKMQPS